MLIILLFQDQLDWQELENFKTMEELESSIRAKKTMRLLPKTFVIYFILSSLIVKLFDLIFFECITKYLLDNQKTTNYIKPEGKHPENRIQQLTEQIDYL